MQREKCQAGMVITPPPLLSQNCCGVKQHKTPHQNRDLLKHKPSLSVIDRLRRKLATQIFQECATRCINQSH